jgi:hypothetical protein
MGADRGIGSQQERAIALLMLTSTTRSDTENLQNRRETDTILSCLLMSEHNKNMGGRGLLHDAESEHIYYNPYFDNEGGLYEIVSK